MRCSPSARHPPGPHAYSHSREIGRAEVWARRGYIPHIDARIDLLAFLLHHPNNALVKVLSDCSPARPMVFRLRNVITFGIVVVLEVRGIRHVLLGDGRVRLRHRRSPTRGRVGGAMSVFGLGLSQKGIGRREWTRQSLPNHVFSRSRCSSLAHLHPPDSNTTPSPASTLPFITSCNHMCDCWKISSVGAIERWHGGDEIRRCWLTFALRCIVGLLSERLGNKAMFKVASVDVCGLPQLLYDEADGEVVSLCKAI